MQTFHIAQDGTSDFTSISAALAALPSDTNEPITLYIHQGIYKEQLTIQRPYLTLIGDSAAATILTYGLYARMPSEDIGILGTFRTYSCLIDTHDFTAKNITFQNSAGQAKLPDASIGQTIALYADGDRLLFEDCHFLSGQDTLFTGPLPPKEIEPNGFIGPKQHAPRINGRHCYRRCYIEGDIDFIFGSATAYFDECEFHSKDINREINSYVTAASTPEGQAYGYVMNNCRFTGSCPPHSAYLGRPWRDHAKTVLINCYIGPHIHPEGWHDWNKPQSHQTTYYAEYQSHGPSGGAKDRPTWTHQLTPKDLPKYTQEQVLSTPDNWQPQSPK